MNLYKIRFNKSRGLPGRGSINHVWRIFENDREFLAQSVRINVNSWSDSDGDDWNIVCRGKMIWFDDTDTAIIN
ncbi:MAG: hypothetical protein EB127_19020 [Alphaproteobacteria bacterium]|nr:hypothetical protein [Alphaproteobacteria bacterium]